MMGLQIEAMKHKDPGVNKMTESLNAQMERVATLQDISRAKALQTHIENYKYTLQRDEIYRDFILWTDKEFCYIQWSDPKLAQRLIAQGMNILKEDPTAPLSRTQQVAESINGLIIRTGQTPSARNVPYIKDLPSM